MARSLRARHRRRCRRCTAYGWKQTICSRGSHTCPDHHRQVLGGAPAVSILPFIASRRYERFGCIPGCPAADLAQSTRLKR